MMYDILKANNAKNIHFHLITDGRDTKVNAAVNFVKELEEKIEETKKDKEEAVRTQKFEKAASLRDKEKELIRIDISAYSPIESDNTIQGLVEFYNGDNVKARYYRTLTDKDYTYIYFDFLNQNKYSKRNLKIKRLLINGKLYDYKDFNEEIYAGTEKIFYISIPRDEIKDVKSFNISFYMMTYDDTNHMISTYVTSEYEKAF